MGVYKHGDSVCDEVHVQHLHESSSRGLCLSPRGMCHACHIKLSQLIYGLSAFPPRSMLAAFDSPAYAA
jgi:hypothetical protein